jgi:hypothetical protein
LPVVVVELLQNEIHHATVGGCSSSRFCGHEQSCSSASFVGCAALPHDDFSNEIHDQNIDDKEVSEFDATILPR